MRPATESDIVLYDHADGVATISLNRPKSLNALNAELVAAVGDALSQSMRDESLCVVLRGTGRSFSAGHDLKSDEHQMSNRAKAMELQQLHDVTRKIRQSPCPVVASVHGYALGAGAEFALTCDLIIAAEDTKFGFPEVSVGLGVTGGISHILPAAIGLAKAKELLFLSQYINALEAERLGIINYVVPNADLADRTEELARTIAAKPPTAIAAAKQCLDSGLESGVDAAFNRELLTGVSLNRSPESVRASEEFRRTHQGTSQ